ncbi:MAG TPA: hypothetical protein VFV07_10885 [Rhizomicrobium sp.]|nr:hypothetical protein [Rhizomicrobium sp.]
MRRKGRRPLAEEPATAQVQLRVTPAQRLDLRRVADEHRTNVASILREAVNEFVSDYRERRVFRRTK